MPGTEELYEVKELDLWDDPLMRVLFWMACAGFGWLVGWTLGTVA